MSELDDLFAEWADESLAIAEEQFEAGAESMLDNDMSDLTDSE